MYDDETGEVVGRETVHNALTEHASTVRFLADLETGFCVLTLREYDQMPATLMEARRIFKDELAKYRKAHANDKPGS